MNSIELSSSLTFPIKLKKIVDAPETDHLIYWHEDGTSFHITDENQFARDIIPNYFKHSNISSFIRQLNMYGFHKVNRIDNGLAIVGTGNDDSQWVHPNFQRDKPELIAGIVRKVTNNTFTNSIIAKKPGPNNSSNELVPYDSVKGDIARLAKMVQFLKKRDEETSEQLKALQDENHELYTELMFLREQHEQQTKCIDMLIEFFSRCAKKPNALPSRLQTKRNILALECPQNSGNVQRNQNEPPRKYFASPSPQQGNLGSTVASNSDMFKGKKVIKISNINQASHIDINTPKTNPSVTNPGLYHSLPTLSHTQQSQKAPVIYTLSLPKNSANHNAINTSQVHRLPIRAITAPNNQSSINIQKPTITSSNHKIIIPKQNQKTVLVSTVNSNPQETNHNAQYVDYNVGTGATVIDSRHFNYNQSPTIISRPNSAGGDCQQMPSNANIVTGISSNLNSVEQCMNDINDMFDSDLSFDNRSPSPSNPNNFFAASNNIVDVDDEDWKMLLENIKSESNSLDPSRIHGHELIPFNGTQTEVTEDSHPLLYGNPESYSIDDLLQTPDIHPGMSATMSQDYMMGDASFQSMDLFNSNNNNWKNGHT